MSAEIAVEQEASEINPPKEKDVLRCYVCFSKNPRYKCPGCQNRTCSLQCVQQHKKELNCSGKRDPTEFVFKKTMNNRLLLRDYRFLEDAGRKTFAWERILRDYSPDAQKSSPYYEGREALTRYAIAKGFVIWQQPAGFSRSSINRTVYSEYGLRQGPGKYVAESTTEKSITKQKLRAKKCFKFHIRWTLHLSNRKITKDETDIYEIWNLGRVVQGVLDNTDSDAASEFNASEVKIEVKEEPSEEEPETIESDETASSIGIPRFHLQNDETMEKPLEMDKKKYSYEVFMKRIVGQELYYQLDKEKTVIENLKGKILLEFPEFIIATNETAQYYNQKSTIHLDYIKGAPVPMPAHKAPKAPKRPRKEKETAPKSAGEQRAVASHPVLDQLVNRDNPNPYDMPKSAPFILKAPGNQSNNSNTSKHAHKSSSRVEIHKQPVKASTLHPGFQSLLGHTSPVKKSGQSRASQKKGPEAARYHPYQQTFNKNEQREVTTSYGAQWNFFEGPEADKQDVKEAEKAPILVNLKEAKANKEQEITVKEEAEVKEEPDSEPELTIVESKPDMTEEEKEEEESKQRLREALALVMEDYESAESDEEEYY